MLTRQTSNFRNVKRTKVAGLPYTFLSGLEARIAQQLKGAHVPFSYEEDIVPYTKPARQHKYKPDFRVGDMFIEAKGRFLAKDRQKHLLIKEQHPELDIRFVFSNPQQRISKTSKTTYAMWCDKHGFKYAKELIPNEWLKEATRT